MQLSEAFQRVLKRHRVLLVSFVLVGALFGGLLHVQEARTYTAEARLVMDTPDPQAGAQSQAIADTARALATSQANVAAALATVGARRDPQVVAAHDVGVQPLGTSGVLSLTVKDRDPRVAAALTNALAAEVIKARLAVTQGAANKIATQLAAEMDDTTKKLVDLDSRIAKIDSQIAFARTPNGVASLEAQRNDLSQQRGSVAQDLQLFRTQLTSLQTSQATKPQPTVVQSATVPLTPDPSRRIADLLLGAFLGLVLGIGVCAALEIVRPTLVGTEALARAMKAPVIAELPFKPVTADGFDAETVGLQLKLAANAAQVRTVELVGAGPSFDLSLLAEELQLSSAIDGGAISGDDDVVDTKRSRGSRAGSKRETTLRIRAFGSESPLTNGDFAGTSLVAVAPSSLREADLARVRHLSWLTGWNMLGVIVYEDREPNGVSRWTRIWRSLVDVGSEM